MDRLVSTPERVCVGLTEGKQLTPLSSDVFVSIPERVLAPQKLCSLVSTFSRLPFSSEFQRIWR
jgi:hypothetical protein